MIQYFLQTGAVKRAAVVGLHSCCHGVGVHPESAAFELPWFQMTDRAVISASEKEIETTKIY